jgi:MFS family permease
MTTARPLTESIRAGESPRTGGTTRTGATSDAGEAGRSGRRAWLPVAAVLFGTGWGAQQFTPMLLVYHQTLGLGAGTLAAMFGVYALGLIPGLLLGGPLSDAWGRRAVIVPAAWLSLAATVTVAAGGHSLALLFAGRLLAGVSSGAVFGPGTAWLREVSQPPWGTASGPVAARRAAIAMSAGFSLGPLVAGVLAQWGPAPRAVPYVPHVAVMAVVLVLLRKGPETVVAGAGRRMRLSSPGLRSVRFRQVVVPMAPWVFAAPAIAAALLPNIAGAGHTADGVALAATITALCALAGVVIQPVARRLHARGRGNRPATAGLLVLAGGLVLGAVAAAGHQPWLLIPSTVVFGSAYGLCLVAGLVEIQRIAGPHGQAGLTATYYMVAYLGFAAPYLIVLAAHLASYPVLLVIAAALALATAALVTARAAEPATAAEPAATAGSPAGPPR